MKTKIFCILLNYNHFLDTETCINALKKTDLPAGTEFVIVDNSPNKDSQKYLSLKFPKIKLIKTKSNLGFAGGNNLGIKYALENSATHVLIINPDVTVGKTFFAPLLKDLTDNPDLGLIAPTIKHKQGKTLLYGLEGHLDRGLMKATHTNLKTLPKQKNLYRGDFVTFACVLIRSDLLRQLLLDTRYFMYLEDVDYCQSANRLGIGSAVDPGVIVEHRTSSSFKKPTDKLKISFISQLKFIAKWGRFPGNVFALVYTIFFYPYLYLLWSVHDLRHTSA